MVIVCCLPVLFIADEIELHFQRSLLQAKTKQKLLKEKEVCMYVVCC